MTGVHFADRLILFGTQGKVYEPVISYSFNAAGPTKHLICDLKPDTSYVITSPPDRIETQTSENGLLYFQTTSVGPALVNITKLSGDIDKDYDVDLYDFAVFALAWRSDPDAGHWNPLTDISEPNDDVIDFTDLSIFFKTWPCCSTQ